MYNAPSRFLIHSLSPGLLLTLLGMIPSPSAALTPSDSAPLTVRGRVYEDRNSNGKPDPDEPGIPSVSITNGRDVVLTGSDGSYALTINPTDGHIQATKPPGYQFPLDEFNIPQSFRLHKPAGSPPLYYKGIEPTGDLPATVDFALRPIEESDEFRAVLFADTQVESGEEVRHVLRKVLGDVADQKPDLLIQLGDIMYDHLDLFPSLNRAVARIGVPVYGVIGNHDLNFDGDGDANSDETFTRIFGPANYSWQIGKAHFVALDTIQWHGRGKSPEYTEILDDRTLEWLRNDLSVVPADRLVILCIHAPLAKNPALNPRGRIGNFDQLTKILQGRRAVLAVSGHTHLSYRTEFDTADGWTGPGTFEEMNCVTVSGSWWSGPRDHRGVPISDQRDGVPNGYTILDIRGGDYRLRYKAASQPDSLQARIFPPGTHESGETTTVQSRRVLANVFYGWSKCRVEYSLNDGPWLAMTQAPQRDPAAISYYSGPNASGKPFVRPVRTNHIWQLDLESAPPSGANRHRIRIQWPDGTTHTQTLIHDR
jgi:predicted phosphodiesterase